MKKYEDMTLEERCQSAMDSNKPDIELFYEVKDILWVNNFFNIGGKTVETLKKYIVWHEQKIYEKFSVNILTPEI